MSKKKMQNGICRLCKKSKELSFEHIPPKVAFNKNTRYYSIPQDDLLKSPNILEFKPNGRVYQGGLGYYSLCRDCNSFLGKNYVRDFSKWVNIGMDLNLKYTFNYIEFISENQSPLKIIKQIVSMFICMNDPWFTESYPDLLDFVKNPAQSELPERYKIYTYLNDEGQIRTLGWSQTNLYGTVCEFTFPPFGYVLNIGFEKEIGNLTNITSFKNFINNNHTVEIGLFKHPTFLPFPLDYRTKQEIAHQIEKNTSSQ